uniref:Uncharacterized protein n=1 Tax=viral metagenome TaxID=1070528 RepID=A0A6M3X4F6_9ZZZZ
MEIAQGKQCPECQKPLFKMIWARDVNGNVVKYILVCDNSACPKCRSPQGRE